VNVFWYANPLVAYRLGRSWYLEFRAVWKAYYPNSLKVSRRKDVIKYVSIDPKHFPKMNYSYLLSSKRVKWPRPGEIAGSLPRHFGAWKCPSKDSESVFLGRYLNDSLVRLRPGGCSARQAPGGPTRTVGPMSPLIFLQNPLTIRSLTIFEYAT